MRIIKLGLISVIFFFVLFTLFSLLIPSSIRLSKAINLRAEEQAIFSLIKDTSQWKLWNGSLDSLVKKGRKANFLFLAQNDSLLTMELKSGDRTIINGWQLYRYPSSDSLTLQWFMDIKLSWYPWQKLSSLFYEKTYGATMERSLYRLKELLHTQQPPLLKEEEN